MSEQAEASTVYCSWCLRPLDPENSAGDFVCAACYQGLRADGRSDDAIFVPTGEDGAPVRESR